MIVTVVTISRFVLLGNHRDAWTFGAVDPNSGTAALLEVVMVPTDCLAECLPGEGKIITF